MSNPNGRKGAQAETDVAGALAKIFPGTERRVRNGNKDRGDINIPGLPYVVEVKNVARLDIPGWLREVDVEVVNAGADLGACWYKLRGSTDPLDWPVVTRGRMFVPLLQAYDAYLHPTRVPRGGAVYPTFNGPGVDSSVYMEAVEQPYG